MPAGCDFVCENEKCKECNKGVVIINKWPLGDIDKVIEAAAVKKNKEFQDHLISLKGDRKYACITYPNVDKVPIAGYRIQKWCQSCFCIWSWDVILEKEFVDSKEASEKFQEAAAKENIVSQCPKCNNDIKDFDAVAKDGIICPHCSGTMKTYRWFSNETEG